VTGFTDAEGCFMINITKRKTNRMGWQIRTCFQIKLHYRDKKLLMKIKSFFNEIGSISFSNDSGVMYRVNKLDDIINIIIPHFDKYSLITQKQSDIVELIYKGKHLNKNGIIKIINFNTVLNKGLSEKLDIFNKHKIIGVKLLDYLDFCLAAELVNKKAHLTLEGIEEIRKIKSRMNKNRYDLYNNELCKTRKI